MGENHTKPPREVNCLAPQKNGKICMLGGVYSDERCPICGGTFKDNHKNALVCPYHPEQKATKFKVIFKGVTRRFDSYSLANRHLTGLRYKVDEGSFDPIDYKLNNPLSFKKKSEEWLEIKKGNVRKTTYQILARHIYRAGEFFQDKDIRKIRLEDFQHFLQGFTHLGDKSLHNHLSTLKEFYKWLEDNNSIPRKPKFPKVEFDLAERKTISRETQIKILDELKRIAPSNVWLAIKWLMTYTVLRPHVIQHIRDSWIDKEKWIIHIPKEVEKSRKGKKVHLTEEDIEIIKSSPEALNKELFYFRNKDGSQFGRKKLYKWWKKACRNLGIEGIELYGGTRHSSCIAMGELGYSPETIRLASQHATDKSFTRYFKFEDNVHRKIYSACSPDKPRKGSRGK